jgi:hypothetical protein
MLQASRDAFLGHVPDPGSRLEAANHALSGTGTGAKCEAGDPPRPHAGILRARKDARAFR